MRPGRSLTKVMTAVMISAALALSSAQVSTAINDEETGVFLFPSNGPGTESITRVGIIYDDNQTLVGNVSNLVDQSKKSPPDNAPYCTSVTDPKCADVDTLWADQIMGPCESASDEFCIESIYAKLADGSKVKGSLKQLLPEKPPLPFDASPDLNLGKGSVPSIWEISGVKNSAGKESYAAIFSVSGYAKRKAEAPNPRDFYVSQLSAALFAVDVQKSETQLYPLKGPGMGLDGVMVSGCATNDETYCAKRVSFPKGVRFGATLRFAKPPQYWFYGRLYKPEIEIKARTGTAITLDVEAEPVTVPVFEGTTSWDKLPKKLQDYYLTGSYPQTGRGSYYEKDPTKWNMYHLPRSEESSYLIDWIPVLGDKARVMTTMWFFRSIPQDTYGNQAKCYGQGSKVNGFVTTNATTYTAGPPSFNQTTGTLDYTVAAPHLTPTGKEMLGTYDLQIDADVARCLYGYTDAPISAEVSIVAADGGENRVATTNVGEKTIAGKKWLVIAAYNFTFSSPTLKVKISQAGSKPSGSTNNSGSNNTSGNNTPGNNSGNNSSNNQMNNKKPIPDIKCVKGKQFKFVSAKKCPKGWVKKG